MNETFVRQAYGSCNLRKSFGDALTDDLQNERINRLPYGPIRKISTDGHNGVGQAGEVVEDDLALWTDGLGQKRDNAAQCF